MTSTYTWPPLGCDDTTTAGGVVVTVTRGDTIRLAVALTTSDGLPVDVTGWEWLAQIRDQADALVATFTAAADDPLTGVVMLTLPAADSDALPVAELRWDLQATLLVGGDVRTVVPDARLQVRPDVSRSGP